MEAKYFTILYWFCHTSTCIRHGCTRVPYPEHPLPPPSPYHPSGSSPCTSPKHPVSCIEPRLAISFLYDIIHVSIPFSKKMHPVQPDETACTLIPSHCWVQDMILGCISKCQAGGPPCHREGRLGPALSRQSHCPLSG